MNTKRKLLNRLIGLYPVKIVKGHFNMDAENAVTKFSEEAITGFCYSNLDNTKQHIYIYHFDKNFTRASLNIENFPLEIVTEKRDAGCHTFICKQLVTFNVKVSSPYEETTIKFYQPIMINILNNRHLVIQATILEKNIASYFEGRKVFESSREVSEETLIGNIRSYFERYYRVSYCDINKGIKAIWEEDLIDSRLVKFKKNRSTSTESMDGDYTVKEQYPEVYQQLINAPLGKTVFRYKKEDGLLIEHFTTEPSLGRLSIPLYPKNPNQIRNVVDKILANN